MGFNGPNSPTLRPVTLPPIFFGFRPISFFSDHSVLVNTSPREGRVSWRVWQPNSAAVIPHTKDGSDAHDGHPAVSGERYGQVG